MQEALVGIVKEVKWDEQVKGVLGLIERRNYSEAGLALRDGKLGDKGFIIGKAIEGLTSSKLKSDEAHARMQMFMAQIIKDTVDGQLQFMKGMLEIKQERTRMIGAFLDSVKGQMQKVLDIEDKAMSFYIEKGDDKLLTHVEKTLPHMKDLMQMAIQEGRALLPSSEQDDKLLEHIINVHADVMKAMNETMKQMSKDNVERDKSFMQVCGEITKEVINAVRQNKALPPSTVQVEELPNESAVVPASPPRKYIGFFKGNLDYQGGIPAPKNDLKQIAFKKDEELKQLEEDPSQKIDGWVKVEKNADGKKEVGYVFSQLLTKM